MSTIIIISSFLIGYAQPYIKLGSLFFSDKAPDFEETPANEYTESDVGGGVVKYKDMVFPFEGDEFARITIDSAGIDVPVLYGSSSQVLKNGVGLYREAYLPGQGRTIFIGGHNTTFFRGLAAVEIGEIIELRTHYGEYIYEVTSTAVVREDDHTAYDLSSMEEVLILCTCHPETMVGLTPWRLMVYAKLVSGPSLEH
ncbi:MAG: class D sortase [Oscillospiraceae bacterium]|nr:class D sortase [Oscillospiraceae bacterium]